MNSYSGVCLFSPEDASLLSNEAAGGGRHLVLSVRHRNGGSTSPASESVPDNSSIQRIIDKYTKELDVSLAAAGNFAGIYRPLHSSVLCIGRIQRFFVYIFAHFK